jgi:activator of HSP90 ATPase
MPSDRQKGKPPGQEDASAADCKNSTQPRLSSSTATSASSSSASGASAFSDAALLHLINPPTSPLLVQKKLEKLDFDVHSWSSYSAQFHPKNIKVPTHICLYAFI